jgi:hypothetical protein
MSSVKFLDLRLLAGCFLAVIRRDERCFSSRRRRRRKSPANLKRLDKKNTPGFTSEDDMSDDEWVRRSALPGRRKIGPDGSRMVKDKL